MQWKSLPQWFAVSVLLNGFLGVWVWSQSRTSEPLPVLPSLVWAEWQPHQSLARWSPPSQTQATFGHRQSLNYEGWVALLSQEAAAMAANPPEQLSVLAGDSISLWFPADLLPPDQVWLNQGISGETTPGLLRRIDAFDRLNPNRIFVMIGINDLLRGTSSDAVLQEQKKLIKALKKHHPHSLIVLQSILPHSAENATWEGRDRLLKLPNQRIAELNQSLKELAHDQDIYYLDLWPLFVDSDHKLRAHLTTDGLHLNEKGYLVWSAALQLFSQWKLLSPPNISPDIAQDLPFRFFLENGSGSQAWFRLDHNP
ncbi:MAG: GDSL-type esterase/lipase family protein [Prochlorotrichaceae cyanobacterium]|jgi:lysophospholipase L1-like esterase